jgi:ATP-dependent Clp protease ATP-binding subunit ClpB
MTSNLGATFLTDMPDGPVPSETKQLVTTAIKGHFPPEFINRVDDVVIFVCFFLLPMLA